MRAARTLGETPAHLRLQALACAVIERALEDAAWRERPCPPGANACVRDQWRQRRTQAREAAAFLWERTDPITRLWFTLSGVRMEVFRATAADVEDRLDFCLKVRAVFAREKKLTAVGGRGRVPATEGGGDGSDSDADRARTDAGVARGGGGGSSAA